MIKILFLIHDLGQGGAEKVLVNLVNNMDKTKFDIHVTALFAGGVNEQFLKPHIKYRTVWKKAIPGNSKILKLFSPNQLHSICVQENYDIEVSYLEGPSARVISGCQDKNTKLFCWIHSNHFSLKDYSTSFRNTNEAVRCYKRFDKIVGVSEFLRDNFCKWFPLNEKSVVLYNTVESDTILQQSVEPSPEIIDDHSVKLIAVGSLKEVKGFDRLLRIVNRFAKEQLPIHLYILGRGPLKEQFDQYISDNKLNHMITLLGYQTNPYRYVRACDLFVCSSHSEGFSTAATEALIVGTPVCTVEVSGMKEMLGNANEYGIVTDNTEEALYAGLKSLIKDPSLLAYYRKQAKIRGTQFNTQNTVKAVENIFHEVCYEHN